MNWPQGMPLPTKIGLQPHADRGVHLSVGDFSYGTPSLIYDAGDAEAKLTIGKFCSFADGVNIFIGRHGRHHYDFLSTYPIGMLFGAPAHIDPSIAYNHDLDVSIGSDVWIARGATIMAGVRIGHGAVIGACSLVTKDVEPYMIAGGVPAKPIKSRFTALQVARLLKLQWWNRPEEELKACVDLFYRSDIDSVLDILERRI